MSQNPDAVANQGEFAGHVRPSEPLMKTGVSIKFRNFGVLLSNIFHLIIAGFALLAFAHILPYFDLKADTSQHQPGKLVGNDAAPEFHAEVLPAGSAPASKTYQPNPDLNNQKMYQDASSTITGATSGDVHTGLGHPGQGQTSKELRHSDKKDGTGLAGRASSVEQGNVRSLKDDPRHADQRNLGDVPTGQRGNTGGPPAQERIPENAESVASEATKQS